MAFNITRWTITLLMLLSILPSVFGLYFYLEDSDQKCFIEELPVETMVIGSYVAEEWNEEAQKFILNKELQLEVVVEEMPDGKRIYGQKLNPKGEFRFTSAESGEHQICLFTAAAGWFSSTKIRLTLDLSIRDVLDSSSYQSSEETLSDLEQQVRELNYKVGDIRREQSYLRDHESEFRDRSEATNSHAVTWTIVQLVVLGITCVLQLRSLRRFFENKKLV
ncbi:emp24/gp25L/p24 family/GOLD-domain-containing protein [Mortierella sp. GBAus27b]|nr:emp24p/erv25p- protein [Mortierella sp. GBA43]KAI8357607.1 emp24/gp25L/p24 family/GOLD-domain-containing protein [Mortierella sp. GBAus27b]